MAGDEVGVLVREEALVRWRMRRVRGKGDNGGVQKMDRG